MTSKTPCDFCPKDIVCSDRNKNNIDTICNAYIVSIQYAHSEKVKLLQELKEDAARYTEDGWHGFDYIAISSIDDKLTTLERDKDK